MADNNTTSAQIAALEVEVRYMRQTLDRVATALDKLAAIEARLYRLDELEKETDAVKAELSAVKAAVADLNAYKFKAMGFIAAISAVGPVIAKKLGFI